MNQPGCLGHSQGHKPYQARDCICHFDYSRFLYYNTRPKTLVQREGGLTAKEHVWRLLPVRHTIDYSN